MGSKTSPQDGVIRGRDLDEVRRSVRVDGRGRLDIGGGDLLSLLERIADGVDKTNQYLSLLTEEEL